MCAGYHLEESKAFKSIAYAAEHHPIREGILGKLGQALITKGDVRISDIVPVIAPDHNGEGHIYPMMWGFSTKLDTLIPTVDIDILDTTRDPALLEAISKHRCLIPTSWYYEWERIYPVDSYATFGDQTPEYERRRTLTKAKVPENPNGSYWAIEGICSPDGRVLGKMGHSERIGQYVAGNIPGNKDQKIFESGVKYFL